MAAKKLRCYKCFITLERMHEDNITDFLIKITKENGEDDYICPSCLLGW